MKHFILLLFIASLASGIGCIIVGRLYYATNKNALLKYLLRTAYSLTLLLLIDIINYYKSINDILYTEPQYLMIILGLLIAGMCLIHAAGNFTYCLIQKPLTKKINTIYVAASITSTAAILILHQLYRLNILEAKTCIRQGFFIQNLYTALGAAYYTYLLIKFKSRIAYKLNQSIFWCIGAVILVVLISLISNFIEFFIEPRYPKPFSPMIYFILNSTGIYFIKNTLSSQLPFNSVSVPEQNASFNSCVPEENPSMDQNTTLSECLNQFELTQREKEIIESILLGATNAEIAEKLFISPNTVKNHIYNIYKKMNIKNRYELICTLSELQKNGA